MKKGKLISGIKFNNGARFKCYLVKNPPKMAKDANDYLYVSIKPEKGRGEEAGWYMNIYDATNLIWLVSNAILNAHEADIKIMPSKI